MTTSYSPRVQEILDQRSEQLKDLRINHRSPYLAVITDKGSWVVYSLILGRDGTEIDLYRGVLTLDDLVGLGLLSIDDLQEQKEHEATTLELATRDFELNELSRLKAKYEPRRMKLLPW